MSGQGASAADRAKELRKAAATAKKGAPRGQTKTALNKQAKAWKAGVAGEERTARALRRLTIPKWVVLHDRLVRPDKAWNLDHVVIGPAGAFFIDAKNWRGQLSVFKGNLWRHWYAGPKQGRKSANMMSEVNKIAALAEQASTRLGVPVRPVLSFAGKEAANMEGPLRVRGVDIVPVKTLAAWLEAEPVIWDQRSVTEWGAYAAAVFPPAGDDGVDRSWVTGMREGTARFD